MKDPLQTLVDVGHIIDEEVGRRLQPTGLSMAQFRLLDAVSANDGITPRGLVPVLLQEAHSVSGMLNRLEARDMIVRKHDREDRRVVHVSLTDAGELLLKQARELYEPYAFGICRDIALDSDADDLTPAAFLALAFKHSPQYAMLSAKEPARA